MHLSRSKAAWYLLALIALAAVASLYVAISEDRRGMLTVSFLDIGQGDSIFIDAPSGNQMLVDGGPGSTVLQRLPEVMPFYDHSIDIVLATHPDSDHVSGLISVLSRYKVRYVIITEATSSTATFAALQAAIRKSGATVVHPRAGEVVDLGGGADFRILFPDRDMSGITDTNTTSIVGKVEYGKESFMLTGDSPRGVEKYLVELDGDTLAGDVLKPGHHGSKTSSSPEFVDAVTPMYAVISDGKNNQYGFPHQATLDTLNAEGAKILRTDQLGTISFKTDGQRVWQN